MEVPSSTSSPISYDGSRSESTANANAPKLKKEGSIGKIFSAVRSAFSGKRSSSSAQLAPKRADTPPQEQPSNSLRSSGSKLLKVSGDVLQRLRDSASGCSSSSCSFHQSSNNSNWKVYLGNPEGPFPTYAFSSLDINSLLVEGSVRLDMVIPVFIRDKCEVTESVTFQEHSKIFNGQHLNCGIPTEAFMKLQRAQNQLAGSSLGSAYSNNYPMIASALNNQIDCDSFHVVATNNCTLSVVADGCGWGLRSKKASQDVVAAVVEHINSTLADPSQPIPTAVELMMVLLKAFALGHAEILRTVDDASEAGTTTASLCFAFNAEDNQKYLMVVGVGDCKTLIMSQQPNGTIDLTEVKNLRCQRFNATDSGGRLGPYVGQNNTDPDLRNLFVACVPLPEDAIVINMTDGVHDNLNPELLGLEPYEVDSSLVHDLKWTNLMPHTRLAMHEKFQNERFLKVVMEDRESDSSLNGLCQKVVNYCLETTSTSRVYMQNKPREPKDKKQYPGKMDHCSITAFRF